jgi:hypothetical protein
LVTTGFSREKMTLGTISGRIFCVQFHGLLSQVCARSLQPINVPFIFVQGAF